MPNREDFFEGFIRAVLKETVAESIERSGRRLLLDLMSEALATPGICILTEAAKALVEVLFQKTSSLEGSA